MKSVPRKKTTPRPSHSTIERHELQEIKSAFGVDNAKQMDVHETVQLFIPQPNFHRLIVKKNQILLGSRGSGKTTWVRMLAHDHVYLAALDQSKRTDYARLALQRNLIGVYVPASAAFTGDLKNKGWQTEEEAEQYFVWRLNLHICSALTHILESCVNQYLTDSDNSQRANAISKICSHLATTWGGEEAKAASVEELRLILSKVELRHQTELRKRRTSSKKLDPFEDHFDNDLLLPFKNAINIIKTNIKIPADAVWMICLDEIEYLSELHHRILNGQIRSASSDIIFKIATMPFAHHTLATNLGDPVREGNDFEYINVDQESIDSRGGQVEGDFLRFARAMFRRRIAVKSPHLAQLDLRSLLGTAPLVDNKRVETIEEKQYFFSLLRKHANSATIIRAERLKDTPKFKNEIVRKMHGALLLREALENKGGNSRLGIYCGESVVVRCCDGNARRLMRVINQLVQKIEINDKGSPKLPIEPVVQNQILESMARDTLSRVHSEPPNGAVAATYLSAIGEYFKWKFSSSASLLGSDQVTSIRIEAEDGEEAQRFIKQAVQLSLMIPGPDITLTASSPTCTGVFHFAFLFSPLFKLLPRRNSSVRLSKILTHRSHTKQTESIFLQQSLL